MRIHLPHTLVYLARPPSHVSPMYAAFRCAPSMSKPAIRVYLEQIYQLQVEDIRTTNLPAKERRDRRGHGVRDTRWKHVLVKMKQPFVWPDPVDVDQDFKGKEIKQEQARAMRSVRGWKGIDKIQKQPSHAL